MKTIAYILFTLLLIFSQLPLVFAQQEPVYTNYMYNTQLYNPAYVGSRQVISAIGQYRTQWVGYEGAPTTQSLAINAPVANKKIGLGLALTNEKIGPLKHSSVYADIAYHLPLSEKSKLSFGIKGGLSTFNANFTSIKLDQENDVSFSSNMQSKMSPNIGAGLFYYTSNFYAGISSPQLFSQKIKVENNGKTVDLYTQKNHYYLTAGYVTPLANRVDFKPTMLLKTVGSAPVQMDLTSSFVYNKLLYAGLNFRSGESFGVLAGLTLFSSLLVGYSYDWTVLTKLNSYNSGSHELILRYDIGLRKSTTHPSF